MSAVAKKSPTPRPRATLRGQWDNPLTSYYLLIGASSVLLITGLAMVLSASSVRQLAYGLSPYSQFFDQAKYAALGLVALVIASYVRPTFLKKSAWVLLIGAVAIQLLVFTPLARNVNGNTNWIYFGPVSVQPSEIAKLALAIWLGMILSRRRKDVGHLFHGLIPILPGVGAVVGLIFVGHDMGTAIIVLMIVGAAVWVAGLPFRTLAVWGSGVMALMIVGILAQSSGNRNSRFEAWLSTECDGQAACYQTKHGLWALGSGGWGGVGLGASAQKWLYLPEAHNDFIYAILGEELGLVGTLLLLVVFGFLAVAMTRIVVRHPDMFVKITAAGIAAWIVGQALVNIGVVIGLIPVIGVPLPLVSYGGSALIMTMAAIGVLISFARDEPGAREALAARSGPIRRSIAVMGRSVGRGAQGRSGSSRTRAATTGAEPRSSHTSSTRSPSNDDGKQES